MKKIIRTVGALLALLCLLFALALPAAQASAKGVYEKTLRFHVLANSDSEEDQALKMTVRDGLAEFLAPYVEKCGNVSECAQTLETMLDEIRVKAVEILRREGSEMQVKVDLGKEFYPARDYGELSYPAGEYESLRVYLGDGEGQNWWCVVFPPLCFDAAKAEDSFGKAGYTEQETALVTKKSGASSVRFFLLDIAAWIKKLFS